MVGIYKITSPSKQVYIGQSINIEQRWKNYNRIENIIYQPGLYRSLLKYGIDNHKFEIIEECSLEQLDERETYWKQTELNKVNGDWSKVLFCGLYDKGGGPKSESWKKNIGLSNSKPKPTGFMSDELKKKIGDGNRGKKHKSHKKNKEHKSFGVSKPKDFSKKLSKILKGKITKPGLPIIQLNKNGDIIEEFKSGVLAYNKTKIKGIYNVLRGRAKTAGGFIWKYKLV